MRFAENLKRFFLAWLLAGLSVALCIWNGLFHVDATHPSTVLKVLWHWYGFLVVASVGWLWYEVVLLVLSPLGFRNTVRWPHGRMERKRWVKRA